jgi:ABC-type glycerol-3-phosphate transport system permease component
MMGFPILWMIFNSLKTHGEVFINIWGPPATPQWSNYPRAWMAANVGNLFRNSLIVAGSSVILIAILAALASYSIAKIKFRGVRVLFILFIIAMLVPQQILIVPLYKLMKTLGIINTHLSLIFPYVAGGLPLAIFIFTTYFRGIPNDIIEAARIDGCRNTRILWNVMAPISWPAISAVVIFEFLETWNEFFLALVFIQKIELRTLPLGVFSFMGRYMIDYSLFFSVLSLSMLPVIIIFLVFQRRFISGLTAGALVG